MSYTTKQRGGTDLWALPAFGRVFDDMLRTRMPAEAARTLRPAMDVEEDENKIVVKTELAGIAKEDVNITLEDGVLTITGEKKSDRDTEERSYHLVERSFGAFQRSVTLPSGVEGDKASAAFENGVLVIEVPKAEAAKPRKLEIK